MQYRILENTRPLSCSEKVIHSSCPFYFIPMMCLESSYSECGQGPGSGASFPGSYLFPTPGALEVTLQQNPRLLICTERCEKHYLQD